METFTRDDDDRARPCAGGRRSWTGGRCPAGSSGSGGARAGPPADFTARYKLDVLAAYDAAAQGEKGAILRREGLYSSHIVDWRRARDAGELAGRGRAKGRPAADPKDAQISRLRKENQQLGQELAKARFVVEVQSKLQAYAGDRCQVPVLSSVPRIFR